MFDTKEYNQKYYQANKEKLLTRSRAWAANNTDKKSVIWKRYYNNHKQYILDKHKELTELKGKYKLVWDNKRLVYEHRLIMEHRLGRLLLPNEIVHHIDGNRENNQLNNLELFDNRKAHKARHQ